MTPLSLLDLAPVVEGGTIAQALANTVSTARVAEAAGYRRVWLAEHHSMPGVASAATALVIQHVAAHTSTITVGAGGVMLPNHPPLVVAEQFGTLAALFPGRIELGLGRAPGTDGATARALRHRDAGPDAYPRDVLELLGYFAPADPRQPVLAVPGAGTDIPVWILGSSPFSAQVAAALGLPYAFAAHFAPAALTQCLEIYRRQFRPSPRLDAPRTLVAVNAIAAESEAEARLLSTSLQRMFVALRSGQRPLLGPPAQDLALSPAARAMLDAVLSCSFVGSAAQVRQGMAEFAKAVGADELMVSCAVWDQGLRERSLAMTAA